MKNYICLVLAVLAVCILGEDWTKEPEEKEPSLRMMAYGMIAFGLLLYWMW